MKIIAEASVPFLRGVAEHYAEMEYLDNKEITSENIKGADALLVRSITKCNKSLLEGSSVKFIATATAGSDHIDADYCKTKGIHWTNAPGCNAMGVAQYVCSSLCLLSLERGIDLKGKKIGIIGVGHVGSLVLQIALALGMQPLLNDPPKQDREGDDLPHKDLYVSLEELQRDADVITLHVPLTKSGEYATLGMVDDTFLAKCKQGIILINACRGGVTKSDSLIRAKQNGTISALVLDCWEGEPQIRRDLLALTDIATPHIAGFSADGKHRGARMALLAISDFFGLGADKSLLEPVELQKPQKPIDLDSYALGESLQRAQLESFTPKTVDRALRLDPSAFESLRKNYPYPREMSAYTVRGGSEEVRRALAAVGFQLS